MSGLQVEAGPGIGGEYSLSRNERKLLYTRETAHANLWSGTIEESGDGPPIDLVRLTSGTTDKSRPRLSPDGRRVLFSVSEGEATNVFVLDLAAAAGRDAGPAPMRQLTYQTALAECPAWSPDGRSVVYLSTEGGSGHVWSLDLAGGSPHRLDDVEVSPWADLLEWSPGPGIIYRAAGLDALTLHEPGSGEERVLRADPGGYLFEPRWSPDGSQVSLFLNIERAEGPEMGLWLYAADGGSHRKLLEGLVYPLAWSPDGDWIYVWLSPDTSRPFVSTIARVPVAGGPPEHICDLQRESRNERLLGLDMTPDGRRLVVMKRETQADAWLVENFAR